MSDSFSVVLGDIAATAKVFADESDTVKAIMPDEGPSCPDGGDASVDGTLHTVITSVGLLHLQIAGAIGDHADKLSSVVIDNYEHTETSVQQLLGRTYSGKRTSRKGQG